MTDPKRPLKLNWPMLPFVLVTAVALWVSQGFAAMAIALLLGVVVIIVGLTLRARARRAE